MAWTYCNDARSKVASGGGRSIGGTSLTVVDGSKYQDTAGNPPSPSAPAKLTIIRWSGSDYSVVTVLKCTGRSGNVLAVDGAADSYADAAVLADDVAMCGPTAGDLEKLQADIAANAAALAGKEPTLSTGSTSQYFRGDKSLATFSISGLIDVPTDGSIAIEGGSGTAASPYRLRARSLVCLGRWGTSTDVAGATGLMLRATSAPAACTPYKILIQAPTNPSGAGGGATVQVKVGGADLLTTAASLAAGSTAVLAVTSGWAISSIADGAQVQPSISAIGGDVRGLLVEVWGRIA